MPGRFVLADLSLVGGRPYGPVRGFAAPCSFDRPGRREVDGKEHVVDEDDQRARSGRRDRPIRRERPGRDPRPDPRPDPPPAVVQQRVVQQRVVQQRVVQQRVVPQRQVPQRVVPQRVVPQRVVPVRMPDGSTRDVVDDGGPDVDLVTDDVRLPDGTRITDALVEEWVEESHRGRSVPGDGA